MTDTICREVNAKERYILANYQHLMEPSERMLARCLVAAEFDVGKIPRSVWLKVWSDFPGMDRESRWKLPFVLCLRVLSKHRGEIQLPKELGSR